MMLDCKWNYFKGLSLLETYEHELTGKYDLYVRMKRLLKNMKYLFRRIGTKRKWLKKKKEK